jgi:hypothetical protein
MTKDSQGKEIIEGGEGSEKLLTQSQVDAIVQERLAREKAKYSGYDELVKFKTEHEKSIEVATQKELEAKKEYEKLKEGFLKKEQDYTGIISKKDSEIKDMRVGSALMGEITKQNAYAEETMALIKSRAIFDKEGNIRIASLDANGLEVLDSVEEGIRKFLTQRPHLVRATKKEGGGTGQGGAGAGSGAGAESGDLNSLNAELLQSIEARDYKKQGELKVKIQKALALKGHR